MKATMMLLAAFTAGAMLAGDKPRVVDGVTVPTNHIGAVSFYASHHAASDYMGASVDTLLVHKGDVVICSFTAGDRETKHGMVRVKIHYQKAASVLMSKPKVERAFVAAADGQLEYQKTSDSTLSITCEIYRP